MCMCANGLTSFLSHDFFSAVEYHPDIVKSQKTLTQLNSDGSKKNKADAVPGIGVQAAFMGSVPGHPFAKKGAAVLPEPFVYW